jgi:hypothetical protein
VKSETNKKKFLNNCTLEGRQKEKRKDFSFKSNVRLTLSEREGEREGEKTTKNLFTRINLLSGDKIKYCKAEKKKTFVKIK